MAKKVIVQNEAQCNKCGDIIVSKHVHDFVECGCGSIFVDGGMEYLKRGGVTGSFIDRSLKMDEYVVTRCVNAVGDSIAEKKNELGIALSVIRTLRDSGILRESPMATHSEMKRKEWYSPAIVIEK